MKKRIMIVDDSLFMRMTLRNIITNELGHEVVAEASNGLEALSVFEETKPDLVTMDITMPEMDGVTALKALRKEHPEAKIMMVSAIGQQAMLVQAITLGAVEFIVKPFDKHRLKEAFDKAFSKDK